MAGKKTFRDKIFVVAEGDVYELEKCPIGYKAHNFGDWVAVYAPDEETALEMATVFDKAGNRQIVSPVVREKISKLDKLKNREDVSELTVKEWIASVPFANQIVFSSHGLLGRTIANRIDLLQNDPSRA